MRVLTIALKDLTQILRDRKSFLFMLVMPIAFTFFFGFLIPSGDGESTPLLRVGVVDHDGGPLSAAVVTMLRQSGAVDVVHVPSDREQQAAADVGAGNLAALVVIPEGLGAESLAGGAPRVTLVLDAADPVGHGTKTVIETALRRALGAGEIARLSVVAAEGARPFGGDDERDAYIAGSLDRVAEAWNDVPLVVALRPATTVRAPERVAPGGFAQSSPGMIVQFAIYGLMTAAAVLVTERKAGALQRLLTTPASRAEVVAGKVLAMFLLVFAQQAILVGVGQLAFGVDYFRAPLATFLVMVSLALWAACMGLFIGAISKGEEQVIMWSLIAMFVFAAMGGAWFPLEVTGKTFATIGHMLPSAWAMDGFQNVVLRGQGLRGVTTPVLVLSGWAVAFFGLAVWRLRFR